MTKVTTGDARINGQFAWKVSMSNSGCAISHGNGTGWRLSKLLDH